MFIMIINKYNIAQTMLLPILLALLTAYISLMPAVLAEEIKLSPLNNVAFKMAIANANPEINKNQNKSAKNIHSNAKLSTEKTATTPHTSAKEGYIFRNMF